MSIDLNGFWQSWDVVSGNTQANNQYDFWKGMVMSNGQVLANQYEFFTYHNTTRYEWFKALQGTYPDVWDEYTFYKNTNDARIYDYSTFYQYGGEYLVGVPPSPTPTPTNTPTPTPTPTPSPVGTIEYVAGALDNVVGYTSMLYSYEGIDWYKGNNPTPNNFQIANQVEYNGSMWLAVGTGEGDNPDPIIYSNNSIDWLHPNDSAGLIQNIRSVIWTGSKWLVGGFGTNVLAESSNGLDWTALQTSIEGYTRISSLCYDGSSMLVAGGSSAPGWIAYSTDLGATWTDTFQTIITTNVRSIAYNGSRWVAVGASSGDRIACSDDGMTWSAVTNPNIVNQNLWTVTWNGTIWLIGGEDTSVPLAVSSNGLDWSATTNGDIIYPNGVLDTKWDGNIFLANGASIQIGSSTDGLVWSGTTSIPADTASIYCVGSKNSPNYYPPIPQPSPTPTPTNTPTPTVTPTNTPTPTPSPSFVCTSPLISTTSLSAYYKLNGNLNGTVGPTPLDAVNGVSYTTGKFGDANGAASFNGSTTYLSTGLSGAFAGSAGNISVMAWVYPTAIAGTYDVVNYYNGSAGWRLRIDGNNLVAQIATFTPLTVSIDANTWTHIGFTFNNTSGGFILYKNGVAVANSGSEGWNITASAFGLRVGKSFSNSGAQNFYSGLVDDLNIWQRALTSGEVSTLANTNCPLT